MARYSHCRVVKCKTQQDRMCIVNGRSLASEESGTKVAQKCEGDRWMKFIVSFYFFCSRGGGDGR